MFSPVDVLGRPFGGSLDVMERLKWSLNWYSRVIVFCPGSNFCIQRKKILGKNIIVVYGRKRLNLLIFTFMSAAMAWKPIFRFSSHRILDRRATFLFEGFLSIFMLPQILIIKNKFLRRKIRVHNDESLFHFDRANSETRIVFRWVLRFEAFRLWFLERFFFTLADFNRCYISKVESERFGLNARDVVIQYLPEASILNSSSKQSDVFRNIVTVANFMLEDNRIALLSFLDQYLPQLRMRGFVVLIGGYGSEMLRQKYVSEPGVRIIGDLSLEDEVSLYRQAMCYLIASNNRAGYKTRISTALSNGLIPILHGRGAEINQRDSIFSVQSKYFLKMFDDKSLFTISSNINDGNYHQLVLTAKSHYKNFLFN